MAGVSPAIHNGYSITPQPFELESPSETVPKPVSLTILATQLPFMKKMYAGFIGLFVFIAAIAQQTATPDQLYGGLFHDVQMARIFPDGKTFVDCTPKRDPKAIVADYKKIKNNPAIRFSLAQFVKENFTEPKTPQLNYITQEKDVAQHIKNLWGVLKREKDVAQTGSSLLPLPNAYIVPGGRFREIYYWDSYFTMLGLKESGETQLMENMVKNFAYLINTYGHIPNGNRSYYISRSQPPFFSLMVDLLAQVKGDTVYAQYYSALSKEYNYWHDVQRSCVIKPGDTAPANCKTMIQVKAPGAAAADVLYRYWDDNTTPRQESYKEDVETAAASGRPLPQMYRHLRAGAASGWDFSSRWFTQPDKISTIETANMLPVDLYCLVTNMEIVMAKARMAIDAKNIRSRFDLTTEKGKKAWQTFLAGQQKKRSLLMSNTAAKKIMSGYFYNSNLGWFSDYSFTKGANLSNPTLAGMFPLFFNLADSAQAARAVKYLEQNFVKPGGVVTSLNNTGQQWDAPNGWAPLQWITIVGLENYGYKDLAKTLAQRWIQLNTDVFKRTGKLMEKYNVMDTKLEAGGGEYPSQDGFGWTNGVLLALMAKYGVSK
jgi:alpha,alpha-trehalase